MVLFGLWHKASVLFVIWGCYHGILLVLHRQLQQLQRRLDWEPPAGIWATLSWITTITLVSLGWIFFRAGSLQQAGAMLAAFVTPTAYRSHFLPGSLYLLIAVLALGYAIVLLVTNALDGYSGRPGTA